MSKKKREKALREYVHEVWEEITRIAIDIRFFQITWLKKEQNSTGGWASIHFQPENFSAELFIYTDIFKEMPSKGIEPAFKTYVKKVLCHETGHVYIWNLEGTKRDTERAASTIGLLLLDLLVAREKKKGKGKKKK